MSELTEAMLFGTGQLFVLESAIGRFEPDRDAPKLAQSPHAIVLWEENLDKRKKSTTEWLKHPDVKVEEFVSPQGKDLAKWAAAKAGELGMDIDQAGIEYFLNRVLPAQSSNKFVEPKVDLWQLSNELAKLAAYAKGNSVTTDMIDDIVTPNNEVESWDIVNALGERDIKKAFLKIEQFYSDDSSDDKAKSIQLNALLAEQFRNILMIQDFQKQRIPDAVILSKTGWKSGRLFVIKKLASKFKTAQLMSVLNKLEHLDIELKTSGIPGQVILQLITAQLS
jgi:DNA polymerase III delta subunit